MEITSPHTVTKRAENTRALTVVSGALAVYGLLVFGWLLNIFFQYLKVEDT
jgi:hypothetical protein